MGGSGPPQASYLFKNGLEFDREGGGCQHRRQQPKKETQQFVSLDPLHILATVTVRLIQPTVHILSRHGILPEAEASTREEVRPEAVDSRWNVVVETTEEGSRDAAGGGHGAAGRSVAPLLATPPS